MLFKLTWTHNILKRLWMVFASLIIVAAIFSSVFRSLTPWATQYKSEIEKRLTALTGQPVIVQSMQTGWYWFHPVLKLEHITLRGEQNSIHLEKLIVGINLFKSLIHWQIQPGILYIDNAHLTVTEKEGAWQIDGINSSMQAGSSWSAEQMTQMLSLLAMQERFMLRHLAIDIHFANGAVIPIEQFNVSLLNNDGHYQFKGDAKIRDKSSTSVALLGNISFDPTHPKDTEGQIYTALKNISFPQWQQLLPSSIAHIDSGTGDLELWFDLHKGHITSAQSHVTLNEFRWHPSNTKKGQTVHSFYANLAWNRQNTGWQLKADHIQLQVADVVWPENQLLVQFDASQQSYKVFIKSLIIESLLSQHIDWPAPMSSLINMAPHGVLKETQLMFQSTQPQYFLTRFEHLGWNAQDAIPKVNNLSGVVQWAPQEGHLELDSEHLVIAARHYPDQTLDLLNGAIDWKELSNGLRVSVDRFVLSQPDLTLSMQGAVDEVSLSSLGAVRLGLEFSAKNVQQWLPYLPQHAMKPKLYHWLTHDIKHIKNATGKITVNGMAKDFPFDNNNGEFSIVSHATGGELLITDRWKPIKDIEGYIRFKNRDLDIDIVHADVQGVPVEQINLHIADIGKNKETLLVHTVAQGYAQKMLRFILSSPLEKHLSKLKMLVIKGIIALDLHLEIPLYPENDDNLVKGTITFKDNRIVVKHHMASFVVDDLAGVLAFNEHGAASSQLAATAFGYPLKINIESFLQPKPLTEVILEGECTIDSLKSQFNLPVFSVLKGLFLVKAILKVYKDPHELEHLTVSSSLKGLAVTLPEPMGKTYSSKAPLNIDVAFNSEKKLRLQASYNNRLSTDLNFVADSQGAFVLASGQISLGGAKALDQKKPGLALVGSLDGFNLEEWNKVLKSFASPQNNNSLFQQLRTINLSMNHLKLFQQNFDKLTLKGTLSANHDWHLNIYQNKISADLDYSEKTRMLSGFVHYLHLDKMSILKSANSTPAKIRPDQIPNLNLRIDDLSVGAIQIGNITLKTHSTPERLAIDYCRIESPVYEFNVTGDWVQKEKINQTHIQAKVHLRNLAKSLIRWNLRPSVDAGKGDVQFDGTWPGSIIDFSLAAVKGALYIQLKDGRITELSSETEQKLGLGKLLSILSLQTIPRRLQLDFSDLSHQGYSFDVFKGDFDVYQGIMRTQESYIDGPVAYASMKGDLDIVKRMYDLDLSISPHITASLPIVATIAGGPIVGFAAWVASKIINQSMQKISAYSYKISGPWSQPVVQQLSITKKAK